MIGGEGVNFGIVGKANVLIPIYHWCWCLEQFSHKSTEHGIKMVYFRKNLSRTNYVIIAALYVSELSLTFLLECMLVRHAETFTSKPVWYHMMAIAIPDVIQHEAAMMWIEGGSNGPGTAPSPPDDQLVSLAVQIAQNTGSIGAHIRQVPNQSMVFSVRSQLLIHCSVFDSIKLKLILTFMLRIEKLLPGHTQLVETSTQYFEHYTRNNYNS